MRLLALLAALAALLTLVEADQKKEIFLPPDCDLLTVVGNGFKLELSQFELAKRNWKESAEEAKKIEQPREADDDTQVVVNEDLFEKTKGADDRPKEYGPLDDQLLRWIKIRATSLLDRTERYNGELGALNGAQRVVLNVLLLNTIVDLDNLAKERIPAIKWLRTKLNMLLKQHIDRARLAAETDQFVEQLIQANRVNEVKLRGTNEPGKDWLRNTQAIKRILTEQRYSEALSKLIISYFAGQFNMMSRSALYQIFKPTKRLDDGLYYHGAARLPISRDFPFSAQDAIANGAYV